MTPKLQCHPATAHKAGLGRVGSRVGGRVGWVGQSEGKRAGQCRAKRGGGAGQGQAGNCREW